MSPPPCSYESTFGQTWLTNMLLIFLIISVWIAGGILIWQVVIASKRTDELLDWVRHHLPPASIRKSG